MTIQPPAKANRRHVHRLSLRASRACDARKASILLGDALNTATLPGSESGSWIVMRTLDLGRISTRQSPASLSLLIQKAVWRATRNATPYRSPAAESAAVVIFPSRSEGLYQLGLRHALKLPTKAWYWNRLLPSWSKCSTRAQQWTLLFSELNQEPAAFRRIGLLLSEALRHCLLSEVLDALPQATAYQWLQTRATFAPTQNPFADPSLDELPSREALSIRDALRCDRAKGYRAVWLVACLMAAYRPRTTSETQLVAEAKRLIAKSAKATPRIKCQSSEARMAPLAVNSQGQSDSSLECTSQTQAPANTEANLTYEQIDPPQYRQIEEATGPSSLKDLRSDFGGLVLFIAILNRLGFPKWLSRKPELLRRDYPTQLLTCLLRKHGATEHDPLLHYFSNRCEPCQPFPDAAFAPWRAAIRVWTKRRLRLKPQDLILRRARIHASDTHLDFCFDSWQVDLRIRRQALDVDPGWIPWLGLVARIHYFDRHEFDA